jgi:hypothetical protein
MAAFTFLEIKGAHFYVPRHIKTGLSAPIPHKNGARHRFCCGISAAIPCAEEGFKPALL